MKHIDLDDVADTAGLGFVALCTVAILPLILPLWLIGRFVMWVLARFHRYEDPR